MHINLLYGQVITASLQFVEYQCSRLFIFSVSGTIQNDWTPMQINFLKQSFRSIQWSMGTYIMERETLVRCSRCILKHELLTKRHLTKMTLHNVFLTLNALELATCKIKLKNISKHYYTIQYHILKLNVDAQEEYAVIKAI